MNTPREESKELSKTITPETISEECKNSRGYLLFVGFLTSERDDKGNAIINWRYVRNHFSLEDVKIAVSSLKQFIVDDMKTATESVISDLT